MLMGSIGVLADIQDRLRESQVETAIIVALVVCGVSMIAILRTVQKATTRLALLGLVFVVGIGLWWQREELEDCRGQCTCRVFGQTVEMPDPVDGTFCPEFDDEDL